MSVSRDYPFGNLVLKALTCRLREPAIVVECEKDGAITASKDTGIATKGG